jgi:hypothetical protein
VLVAIGLAVAGVKLKPPLPEEWEEEEEEEKERQEGQDKGPGSEQQKDQQQGPDITGQQAEPGPEEPVPFFSAALPFGPFLALAAIEYLFFGAAFFALLAGR